MGTVTESRARAYHTKDNQFVCPVCATDEERAADENEKFKPEPIGHEVHDPNPVYCIRCKKKIEK